MSHSDPGRRPSSAELGRALLQNAKREKRIKASSSWRDFFREISVRLGVLTVLILAAWAASTVG